MRTREEAEDVGDKGFESTFCVLWLFHFHFLLHFHFLFFYWDENCQFVTIICLKKDRKRSETVANSDNTVQQ